MGKQARTTSREVRNARAAAERRRKKLRRIVTGGGAVVIIGLVIAIVVAVVNAARPDAAQTTAGQPGELVAPAIATAKGAIALGKADAPVKVEVYLDYMCPFCGRFERANADDLDRMLSDGTIRLELYPLSFLDRMSSGSKYSTRTANAVATVADRSPDHVLAFNNALFAKQPAEGTRGLSDEEIAALARAAGVPQDVVNAFVGRTFEPWISASTTGVFDSGITGTPTVKINGKVFEGDLYTAGPLRQAVTAAKGTP